MSSNKDSLSKMEKLTKNQQDIEHNTGTSAGMGTGCCYEEGYENWYHNIKTYY